MKFLFSWGPWLAILAALAAVGIYFRKQLFTLVKGLPEGNLFIKKNAEGQPAAGAAAEAVLGPETAESAVAGIAAKIQGAAEALPIFGRIVGVDPYAGYVDMEKSLTYDHINRLFVKFYQNGKHLEPMDWRSVQNYKRDFATNLAINPTRFRIETDAQAILWIEELWSEYCKQNQDYQTPDFDIYSTSGLAIK